MIGHTLPLFFIPSPPWREWLLFGRLPIRAYALCIIAGVIIGTIVATRRWIARGGSRDAVETVALVSVPFGIVGARLYHVITDYQLYFGPGRTWYRAFFIWDGGLGIWGGVALGAFGGYLVARRRRIRFWALADALAPGVAIAQAVGRLGNWFNQELFGRPSTLPWALKIDPQYRPVGYEQYATFHPTFLYELIWDVAVAIAVIALDRRFRLGHGKAFMLYVMFYTAGRAWVESLRIDPAHHLGPFRLNDYVSGIVFLAALLCLLWLLRNKPGRELVVEGDRSVVGERPGSRAGETPPVPASDSFAALDQSEPSALDHPTTPEHDSGTAERAGGGPR
ncbi:MULTISPECIES: prolipoprotein diacylglyceryl transferase [Actinomycetes]|jgi:prolipoprotein diacylglyceryl transferase|uniref:Phosphatidylglycerol--prolipoprotein diacylglyceryl transferase n=1 Tax=Metallococcus carri TaxID=1656884 RepID=A0A967AZ20_9MICO|nr:MULTISPECIES: prolipoprotein diacylglyceryl transferase [Actinomycetes]NHN54440.1 prolipoprotein diacylglyceryl transferase [Metallococcus carri]NOP36721.1 prolipoprotein diacylglyceryl transferase [Calidifontibacter sp. DB2511S]OYO05753.1 prolipoprotein diacylglyceryl transferase [Enemella evansiae]UZF58459.1 prolipoprotein diacylglyceryl transferase [Gordonia polyisoprenivorans]